VEADGKIQIVSFVFAESSSGRTPPFGGGYPRFES
jgi:hypothetical protein